MRKIDTIIIHCTDTKPGMDVVKQDLRQWHVIEKGWSDIGYHYLINRPGFIVSCRPIERAGAHTQGYNGTSVGIALAGGATGFDFTHHQMRSLNQLVETLINSFPAIKMIAGHRDFNKGKSCPCFDVKEYFKGTIPGE